MLAQIDVPQIRDAAREWIASQFGHSRRRSLERELLEAHLAVRESGGRTTLEVVLPSLGGDLLWMEFADADVHFVGEPESGDLNAGPIVETDPVAIGKH